MGNCMINVKSRDEKKKLEESFPAVVTLYHKKGCPHCEEIKPVVEEECNAIDLLAGGQKVVPIISCPVEKDFCREEAMNYGATGVPFLVGKPQGQEPWFTVTGSNKKEVRHYFNLLQEMIGESTGNPEQGPVPEQPRQQSQQQNTYYSQDNPGMIDAMYRQRSPATVSTGYDPSPRPVRRVQMCTPGVDCSPDDFEQRVISFLNARKPGRNKLKS
jgi:hypothetical protein